MSATTISAPMDTKLGPAPLWGWGHLPSHGSIPHPLDPLSQPVCEPVAHGFVLLVSDHCDRRSGQVLFDCWQDDVSKPALSHFSCPRCHDAHMGLRCSSRLKNK